MTYGQRVYSVPSSNSSIEGASYPREVVVEGYPIYETYADYGRSTGWRSHPVMDAIFNNILLPSAKFINGEILLNKDNIRVHNALRHPRAMDAVQEGGNIAGAIASAPFAAEAAAEAAAAASPYIVNGLRFIPQIVRGGANLIGETMAGTGQSLLNMAMTGGGTVAEGVTSLEALLATLGLLSSAGLGYTLTHEPGDFSDLNPFAASSSTSSSSTSASTTAPADTTSTAATSAAPSEPEKPDDKKKKKDEGPKSTLEGELWQRLLWETKNNNFGNNHYKWRNAGRVCLGLGHNYVGGVVRGLGQIATGSEHPNFKKLYNLWGNGTQPVDTVPTTITGILEVLSPDTITVNKLGDGDFEIIDPNTGYIQGYKIPSDTTKRAQ